MQFQQLKEYLENIPFWKYLGIKVHKVENGYVELYLPFKKELGQVHGNMHGGALATLLDTAGAVAVRSTINHEVVNTTEMKINYLRPVTPDQSAVIASGRVIHAGETLGVSNVELRNSEEKLVAAGIGTYIVLNR